MKCFKCWPVKRHIIWTCVCQVSFATLWTLINKRCSKAQLISFNRNGNHVSVCVGVWEKLVIGAGHVWACVFCTFDSEIELGHICITDLHNENQSADRQGRTGSDSNAAGNAHYISHLYTTWKSGLSQLTIKWKTLSRLQSAQSMSQDDAVRRLQVYPHWFRIGWPDVLTYLKQSPLCPVVLTGRHLSFENFFFLFKLNFANFMDRIRYATRGNICGLCGRYLYCSLETLKQADWTVLITHCGLTCMSKSGLCKCLYRYYEVTGYLLHVIQYRAIKSLQFISKDCFWCFSAEAVITLIFSLHGITFTSYHYVRGAKLKDKLITNSDTLQPVAESN